jgi:hypothetical protein
MLMPDVDDIYLGIHCLYLYLVFVQASSFSLCSSYYFHKTTATLLPDRYVVS